MAQKLTNAMKPFLPPPRPRNATRSVHLGVPSALNTHMKSVNRHHSQGKSMSNGKNLSIFE